MYFLFRCEISFFHIELPKKLYKGVYFIDKSGKTRFFILFRAQKRVSLAVCYKRAIIFCVALKKTLSLHP